MRQLGALMNLLNSERGFRLAVKVKLSVLAVGLTLLWLFVTSTSLTRDERIAWESVRAAQKHLFQWRQRFPPLTGEKEDPWRTGLIGIEWSPITTTLGSLSAKRTSTNPFWTVQFTRWFNAAGLNAGDPVAIYSSGSFPGMLLSAIKAVETMRLKPLLIVSLGASTWGANHPAAPWPQIARELRRSGFIRTKADFYTLGGEGEMGRNLSDEGRTILINAAKQVGVTLLSANDTQGMITLKSSFLRARPPRLFINIGGSHANLGDEEEILHLPPGMVLPSNAHHAGNGVIGFALASHIPVIHILNLKSLSMKLGLPFDSPPRESAPSKTEIWWYAIGLIAYLTLILTHNRWKKE